MTAAALDHHAATCEALMRSTPLVCAALRDADGSARPPGMRWTNAEIGAHMVGSVIEAEKAARGEASLYDGQGPTAAIDEEIVAQLRERDPGSLAQLIDQHTASFLATVRHLPAGDRVNIPRATVATLGALLALDHHLHGGQFAETSAGRWEGRVADLHAPLSIVLAYAFDPVAAGRFRGSYTLRLKGVEPVSYAIDHGGLDVGGRGRTDCTITADPQTFLRLGIGLIPQARAVLTGRMRAGGRKPWLALAVQRLFPPVPHGGVSRRAR